MEESMPIPDHATAHRPGVACFSCYRAGRREELRHEEREQARQAVPASPFAGEPRKLTMREVLHRTLMLRHLEQA
jgi:hypothetical protein